jgi:uncharacterized protein
MTRTLSAPVTVAFDYTRSTGPVIGRFLTGLRDGQIVGGRTSDGTVVVPPPEFDPVNHQPITDFVEVAAVGTVTSWTWVPEPVKDQPFDRPFAFVLVLLDGADIAVLHLILGVPAADVRMGMRVRAVWKPREEWTYSLENIDHFEPTGEPDADYDTYKQHL